MRPMAPSALWQELQSPLLTGVCMMAWRPDEMTWTRYLAGSGLLVKKLPTGFTEMRG